MVEHQTLPAEFSAIATPSSQEEKTDFQMDERTRSLICHAKELGGSDGTEAPSPKHLKADKNFDQGTQQPLVFFFRIFYVLHNTKYRFI